MVKLMTALFALQTILVPVSDWLPPQEAVGGYIEALTFATDCAAIVNEEGKLRGLPVNFEFLGDVLVGNVLFVGVDGENFCGLKEQAELFLMGMLDCVYWVERGERQNA